MGSLAAIGHGPADLLKLLGNYAGLLVSWEEASSGNGRTRVIYARIGALKLRRDAKGPSYPFPLRQ